MSGSQDTSTPAQRQTFVSAITSVGLATMAQAQAVANCIAPLPETAALLLNLAPPVTFATPAALVMLRINSLNAPA